MRQTHHITDIWGFTAPGDGARWGLWPLGAAWVCHHLWEHFAFGLDADFLRHQAYPEDGTIRFETREGGHYEIAFE